MKHEDIEKLIGGYATGNLTPEERKTLFDAALRDQKLFDALADEESLRQLLLDPMTRARLLTALAPARPASKSWWSWLQRPAAWALAGSFAGAVLLIGILMTRPQEQLSDLARHAPPAQSEPAARPAEEAAPPAKSPAREKTTHSDLRRRSGLAPAPMPQTPASPRDAAAPKPGEPVPPSVEDRRADEVALLAPPPQAAKPAPVAPEQRFTQLSQAQTFRAASSLMPAGGAARQFRQTQLVAADSSGVVGTVEAEAKGEKRRALGVVGGVPAAAAGVSPLGLRYQLQQRAGPRYTAVDPDLPLASTEPLRLEVEANTAGYLYAFEIDEAGTYRRLPAAPVVDPHTNYTIELPDAAHDHRVVLILSRAPEATLAGEETAAATMLAALRNQPPARPLLREKENQSYYIVDSGTAPRLVVEVAVHRP